GRPRAGLRRLRPGAGASAGLGPTAPDRAPEGPSGSDSHFASQTDSPVAFPPDLRTTSPWRLMVHGLVLASGEGPQPFHTSGLIQSRNRAMSPPRAARA